MTYKIKALGLAKDNLDTKNVFRNVSGGLEINGMLLAWYAKCYFTHRLYFLKHKLLNAHKVEVEK